MKMLYLIRHAKSSWDYPQLKDIERPLEARGLSDAPFMAKFLQEKGVKPDKIISSPARRAYSTAVFFAQAQGIDPSEILTDEEVYHAYADDILQIARNWKDAWNTVFLFGHNPTFTSVANFFAEERIDNVPTCGIVAIGLETDKWQKIRRRGGRIEGFYYPKQFKR